MSRHSLYATIKRKNGKRNCLCQFLYNYRTTPYKNRIVHFASPREARIYPYLTKRLSILLRILQLHLVRKVRVEALYDCTAGMAGVSLRGEHVHAGAVEDGSANGARMLPTERTCLISVRV